MLTADTPGAAVRLQLPHRPGRAGRRGRRGARTGALPRDRGGRHRARLPHGRARAADGGAQPAAGRAGRRRPNAATGRRTPSRPRPAEAGARTRSAELGRGCSRAARRPVFVAGRGARARRAAELRALAEAAGALLATSAVANGLFAGDPWSLGISGGFASPLAAELIAAADLVVGWGCALNHVDHPARQADRAGRHASSRSTSTPPRSARTGRSTSACSATSAATARDALAALASAPDGYRSGELRARIASQARWRDVALTDESTTDRIDPRVLSRRLDELLPAERIVSVDSGNFMGYPSAYLGVPDEYGFCFTQAFQSIGLGLATAIGAALARPDRLPVAALGDGGCLMARRRAGHRRSARPADGDRGLQRRGLRRRGAPLHGPGPRHGALPGDRHRRHRRAASAARRSPCARSPTSTASPPGSTVPATARCWSTRRSPATAARGGSPRRSASRLVALCEKPQNTAEQFSRPITEFYPTTPRRECIRRPRGTDGYFPSIPDGRPLTGGDTTSGTRPATRLRWYTPVRRRMVAMREISDRVLRME